MSVLWAAGLAYLLGSFPTGYLVGRWVRGVDIRKHGSGNVGASNVFRVVGLRWGLVVLAVDILKGWVAVSVLYPLFSATPNLVTQAELFSRIAVGFSAIAGHNWTVFLRFKGGKGVATTCGVFLAILPRVVLSALLIWIVVVSVYKYISLASICAALSCPLWVWAYHRHDDLFGPYFLIAWFVPVLIVFTHRSNIARLCAGSEHKITDRKKT